jgi:hypothetical protein
MWRSQQAERIGPSKESLYKFHFEPCDDVAKTLLDQYQELKHFGA